MITLLENVDVLTSDGNDDPVGAVHVVLRVRGTGDSGHVWRLPDGRLAVLTIASVDRGAETTVRTSILEQFAHGLSILKGHMTSLGIADGLRAWVESD